MNTKVSTDDKNFAKVQEAFAAADAEKFEFFADYRRARIAAYEAEAEYYTGINDTHHAKLAADYAKELREGLEKHPEWATQPIKWA